MQRLYFAMRSVRRQVIGLHSEARTGPRGNPSIQIIGMVGDDIVGLGLFVPDFGGVEVFAVLAFEEGDDVVGRPDGEVVKVGFFQGEHLFVFEGLDAFELGLFPTVGEGAVFEGEEVVDRLFLFVDLVVVDVDEVVGLFDVEFHEGFGIDVARPILDLVFLWVEGGEELFDVVVVVEENGDVDIPVPRDDAAVAVGAEAGTAIDPIGDLMGVEQCSDLF